MTALTAQLDEHLHKIITVKGAYVHVCGMKIQCGIGPKGHALAKEQAEKYRAALRPDLAALLAARDAEIERLTHDLREIRQHSLSWFDEKEPRLDQAVRSLNHRGVPYRLLADLVRAEHDAGWSWISIAGVAIYGDVNRMKIDATAKCIRADLLARMATATVKEGHSPDCAGRRGIWKDDEQGFAWGICDCGAGGPVAERPPAPIGSEEHMDCYQYGTVSWPVVTADVTGASAKLAEVLPCTGSCMLVRNQAEGHHPNCPAIHRPAVAALLAARDARIAELERQVETLRAALVEAVIAAAECPTDPLPPSLPLPDFQSRVWATAFAAGVLRATEAAKVVARAALEAKP